MAEIQVAVGVIRQQDKILLAQRAADAHQGGKWEFPGGKIEAGESFAQALERELLEEIGIRPNQFQVLISIPWDYGTKRVRLQVAEISDFSGEPSGREGQPLRWVRLTDLAQYEFPPANQGIIRALELSDCYVISPDTTDVSAYLAGLKATLEAGYRLIQFRLKALDDASWIEALAQSRQLCAAYDAQLVVNASRAVALDLGMPVHLPGFALFNLTEKPKALTGASCHSLEEIAQANQLGIDFITISPVQATKSHPGVEPLGWERFQTLVNAASMPVFALGGMRPERISEAKRYGAQGCAGIRGFWQGEV